jgi:hypothetical protein
MDFAVGWEKCDEVASGGSIRMRRAVGFAGVVALAMGGITMAAASGATPSIQRPVTFTVHETFTPTFVDLAPTGPSAGDQLVGTGRLTGAHGGHQARETLRCTSVNAEDSLFDCTFVERFGDGTIEIGGALSTTHPNGAFPVLGGTGRYQNVRGQVINHQLTETTARLTFQLIP